jgi:hypothetical protein
MMPIGRPGESLDNRFEGSNRDPGRRRCKLHNQVIVASESLRQKDRMARQPWKA